MLKCAYPVYPSYALEQCLELLEKLAARVPLPPQDQVPHLPCR
jgi:hypothetical protein